VPVEFHLVIGAHGESPNSAGEMWITGRPDKRQTVARAGLEKPDRAPSGRNRDKIR